MSAFGVIPTLPLDIAITREVLDDHMEQIAAYLANAKAVSRQLMSAGHPGREQAMPSDDEVVLETLGLQMRVRSQLILGLEEEGRLAVGDREALLAEAQFLIPED